MPPLLFLLIKVRKGELILALLAKIQVEALTFKAPLFVSKETDRKLHVKTACPQPALTSPFTV